MVKLISILCEICGGPVLLYGNRIGSCFKKDCPNHVPKDSERTI